MADDLPLSIQWKALGDFFNCPVCMGIMKDTHVTKCGHRYCGSCIRECVSRHHKCPCCNTALSAQNLIRDHQFDELIEVSVKEREKSEEQYFDKLLGTAVEHDDGDPVRSLCSPVESTLRAHLKKTFMSFEKYYQEMRKDFKKKISDLEEELQANKERVNKEAKTDEERTQKIEQLENQFTEKKQSLDKSIEHIGILLGDTLNKYLNEHIPDISVLPVTVAFSLLNKGIQISNVVLKPHDSMEDIKDLFRQRMQERRDKIIEFGENTKFLCFSPLAKKSLYEMHKIAEDIIEGHLTDSDVIVLPEDCIPVLQYRVKPGSEIAVFGQVKFESDLPKMCFTVTFRPDEGQAVDYFSCKDCKVNWVCRSCMETCHKEHNVAPYIMNHRPTWACCYCARKNKCILQN